jgi:hypothetical protein
MAVMSALRLGHHLPRRKILCTHFCWNLIRPQGYSPAGKISSIEKSNDHIGNLTRDLLACSIVPQPTTLQTLRALYLHQALLGTDKRFASARKQLLICWSSQKSTELSWFLTYPKFQKKMCDTLEYSTFMINSIRSSSSCINII